MRQGENTEFAWENVNVIQSEIAVVVQWLTHVMFATPWPETSQALCPPLSLGVSPNSCPVSH